VTQKRLHISPEAEVDLLEIGTYTRDTWGWRQADKYLSQLEEGCELIVRIPSVGRECDRIREGLHRFEIGKHVIFYTVEAERILVARVLHENMLATNYF
jgi:toxin ParE1/3/4